MVLCIKEGMVLERSSDIIVMKQVETLRSLLLSFHFSMNLKRLDEVRVRIPHAPMPEASGGGQEEQPRLEAGAVAGRTNPRSKELWLRGHRRA